MTKPKGSVWIDKNGKQHTHFAGSKLADRPADTDVRLIDEGTLIGFTPLTEVAQDWFRLNVESEDWQWMGNTLWVDHRLARDLMQAVVDEGLELGT